MRVIHLGPIRASLKASIWDAGGYSFMVGIGESYISAFALALGYFEGYAALIAVVPIFTGSLLQLSFMPWSCQLRSQKSWVLFFASLQGLILLTLGISNLCIRPTALALFLLMTVYWMAGLAAGPVWNQWIGRLVPRLMRVEFFSRRTRVAEMCNLAGMWSGGLLLYFLNKFFPSPAWFSVLFILGSISRGVSVYFLSKKTEKPYWSFGTNAETQENLPLAPALSPDLKNKMFFFVSLIFLVQFATHTAAPFFNPFLLKCLKFDYWTFTVIATSMLATRILTHPLVEKLAKKYGPKSLLLIGLAGISPLPLVWSFVQHPLALMAVQCLGGFAWGCFELGIFLHALDTLTEKARTRTLMMFNASNATGILAGSLLGFSILGSGVLSLGDYKEVFFFSALFRWIPLMWIGRQTVLQLFEVKPPLESAEKKSA